MNIDLLQSIFNILLALSFFVKSSKCRAVSILMLKRNVILINFGSILIKIMDGLWL